LSDKEHEDQCLANYSGSSDKMEVDAMKTMFSRSEEKFQVKYILTTSTSEMAIQKHIKQF